VSFLSRLLDAGVDVRFADLPQIEGAIGKFMLQQMVAIAELEAGLISARTKAALAEAKKRGVVLGGYKGREFARKDIKASVATRHRPRPDRERAAGGRHYVTAGHCSWIE
jgi:DNA invertase Pin-like site-specific DNA recombinase